MKKELIISDIDFITPAKDTTYSDNIIRNLLGNYYLATGDKSFLWRPDNIKIVSEKKSLANSESDVLLSSNEQSNKELVTLLFKMNEWKGFMVDESAINKLKENINNLLSSSFFYGLSKQKNTDKPLKSDEEKLTQQYGKYFYDYSMVLTSPVVLHQVSQENIDKSTSLVSVAEVQPLYNFYDKDFETVAANNPEQSLFNYYTLYYYLLENLDSSTKEKFLNQNVLPLLTKYKAFIDNYLASNSDKENLGNKLKNYKETNPESVLKKTIAILPDAIKVINEVDTKKAEQPFGINITFPPQPKKTIGALVGSTSAAIEIETFVNSKDPSKTLGSKAYAAELFYNNDNKLFTNQYSDIPVISLNDWIQKLEPTKNTLANNETIMFTKNESDKDSVFLQKIKKVLLQKKVDSLIQDNKRSFTDILAGVPAYNEILLFQIIKYSNNQPIQSILIPNTEDLDFYQYFDTQIKYDTTYTYEVIAWTFIIGNKYKYFDRIEIPKITTYKLKNNSSTDSEYFRWFRVAHVLSTLFNEASLDDAISNHPELFAGGLAEAFASTDKINLSRVLNSTYNNIGHKYADDYNKAVSSYKDLNKNIADLKSNIANNFSKFIANVLTFPIVGSDPTGKYIEYQTEGRVTKINVGAIATDIVANDNINKAIKHITYKIDISNDSSRKAIFEILSIFKQANVLSSNFDINYIMSTLESLDLSNITKSEAIKKIRDNIYANFEKSEKNNFLEGGFSSTSVEVDLTKDPNYGLSVDNDYYPRFYIKKDNSAKPKLSGQLQFGVYNEVDIILAGLPYVDKTPARVISAPPPPPEVSVIPYKNVSNKIKFFLTDSTFTYRDYPIYMTEEDTAAFDKALEYEKARNLNDGKITFKGDEPSALFGIYRLEQKPKLYSDFIKGKISIASPSGGGFEDNIEPNKKYYYTFRSADNHNMFSNPSAIYEIEIVENSGAIYPIINIVELEKEEPRTKNISFKDQIKINVNQQHILEKSDSLESALSIKGSDFGSLTPSLFGKNFKIRITSKTTKKKLDINLSFDKSLDFKNVTDLIEQLKKKVKDKSKIVKA